MSRSSIDASFALNLGGLVFSGFSHTAGVCDTSMVIALVSASGARAHELSRRSAASAIPVELRLHSGATASEGNGMMILICYDGCGDAQAATDRAGLLGACSDGTVLVVRETLPETMTHNGSLGVGLGLVGDSGDGDTDAALERAALETATDGAQRATAPGLVARPRMPLQSDADHPRLD